MTHEELLFEIDNDITYANGLSESGLRALRAVVVLHKPEEVTLPDGSWGDICTWCSSNGSYSLYPCMNIQIIEKELK